MNDKEKPLNLVYESLFGTGYGGAYTGKLNEYFESISSQIDNMVHAEGIAIEDVRIVIARLVDARASVIALANVASARRHERECRESDLRD